MKKIKSAYGNCYLLLKSIILKDGWIKTNDFCPIQNAIIIQNLNPLIWSDHGKTHWRPAKLDPRYEYE